MSNAKVRLTLYGNQALIDEAIEDAAAASLKKQKVTAARVGTEVYQQRLTKEVERLKQVVSRFLRSDLIPILIVEIDAQEKTATVVKQRKAVAARAAAG